MRDVDLSRRSLLKAAGGTALVATGLALRPGPAAAGPAEAAAHLEKLLGGATAREGKVKLDLPDVADNGATVPMGVIVDSPMTADDHVKSIHIVADGNPLPAVAAFNFTPRCGKAEVTLRIRLAKTQNVQAVAFMSDGSAWTAKRQVKVTIGGC